MSRVKDMFRLSQNVERISVLISNLNTEALLAFTSCSAVIAFASGIVLPWSLPAAAGSVLLLRGANRWNNRKLTNAKKIAGLLAYIDKLDLRDEDAEYVRKHFLPNKKLPRLPAPDDKGV